MQTRATYPPLQVLLSEAAPGTHLLGTRIHTQRQGFSAPWGKSLDADTPHVSSPLSYSAISPLLGGFLGQRIRLWS